MEERNYECVESFVIEKYDADETPIENEWFDIPLGSKWYAVRSGGMSDIRLDSDLGWLEITKESLERHFKLI